MKLICSPHHKKKPVEISSPKYAQVGARLHHFNCRFYKKCPRGMPPDTPSFQGFLIFVTGTPGYGEGSPLAVEVLKGENPCCVYTGPRYEFTGINRKIQLKYQPQGRPHATSNEGQCSVAIGDRVPRSWVVFSCLLFFFFILWLVVL